MPRSTLYTYAVAFSTCNWQLGLWQLSLLVDVLSLTGRYVMSFFSNRILTYLQLYKPKIYWIVNWCAVATK